MDEEKREQFQNQWMQAAFGTRVLVLIENRLDKDFRQIKLTNEQYSQLTDLLCEFFFESERENGDSIVNFRQSSWTIDAEQFDHALGYYPEED